MSLVNASMFHALYFHCLPLWRHFRLSLRGLRGQVQQETLVWNDVSISYDSCKISLIKAVPKPLGNVTKGMA